MKYLKTKRRWLAGLLAGFALLSSLRAEEVPQLIAIMQVGSYRFALFRANDEIGYAWKRQGEKIGEYQVGQIAGAHTSVTDAGGKRVELTVPPIRPVGDPEIERREWVNSEANPMVWNPVRAPRIIERALKFLPSEEQDRFFRWYENYGWKAAFAIGGDGAWSIAYENVYGEYRRKLLEKRMAAFRQALTPEQRDMYEEITTPLPYDKYQAKREKLVKTRARFEASLSPELMKTYRSFSRVDALAASS